jgi:flavodoxin I
MKALIVYDSFFGNTEKIAMAVKAGLSGRMDVSVAKPADAGRPGSVGWPDLLVMGSPTRGFRPLPAVVQWISQIPADALKGAAFASFDTRMAPEDIRSRIGRFVVTRFGYAAESMHKRLLGKGGAPAAPAEGFLVKASEGPLKEGELERAAEWARRIAENLQTELSK